MAIRLAFMKVTSLPLANFIILDEPAVSLDSDNLEGFIKVLEITKEYFDFIILISHLEILQESADNIIEIVKNKEGYAKIEM
jgi:DNA repair exonuclease SbcCD ATPase subunit